MDKAQTEYQEEKTLRRTTFSKATSAGHLPEFFRFKDYFMYLHLEKGAKEPFMSLQ